MDMKPEVVVVPVAGVDKAKDFYQALGWRLDAGGVFRHAWTYIADERTVPATPGASA